MNIKENIFSGTNKATLSFRDNSSSKSSPFVRLDVREIINSRLHISLSGGVDAFSPLCVLKMYSVQFVAILSPKNQPVSLKGSLCRGWMLFNKIVSVASESLIGKRRASFTPPTNETEFSDIAFSKRYRTSREALKSTYYYNMFFWFCKDTF